MVSNAVLLFNCVFAYVFLATRFNQCNLWGALVAFGGALLVTWYSSQKTGGEVDTQTVLLGNVACFFQVIVMAASNTICDKISELEFDMLH
mmetsp:Transcript_39013/g.84979  ORF Transcript_39013/g.84979 Transcript_39013/m.84979 type:complete len:91 (+) Transcript_39013:366-638(+)